MERTVAAERTKGRDIPREQEIAMVLGWQWTCSAGDAASGGHAATTGPPHLTWVQALFEKDC